MQDSETPSPYRGLVYLTIALSGTERSWSGSRLDPSAVAAPGRDGLFFFHNPGGLFDMAWDWGAAPVHSCAHLRSAQGLPSPFARCRLQSRSWAAFTISRSLPYWPINPGMYTNDWGPWHLFQLDLLRTAWMVLPASLLWGASFPLAIAAIAVQGRDPGRMVGAVYASNTVGAILGSLGFSLFVIPFFGTQWAATIPHPDRGRLRPSSHCCPVFWRRAPSISRKRPGFAGFAFSHLVLYRSLHS